MSKHKRQFNKRFIFVALLFVIGAYVILPQLAGFEASRHMISHPGPGWLAAAIACMLLTYFAAAGTYYFLAFKKLKYWRTVVVELAVMFINRLLPGGVGALGANYLYLKRSHSNSGQAGTIVAINNALGFLGHALLALTAVLAYSGSIIQIDGNQSHGLAWIKYVVAGLVVALVVVVIFARSRINKVFSEIDQQLLSYGRRPWKLVAALATSMLLTSSNVLCLYFSMKSVGVGLSLLAVFLIFSFAVTAGTATPTPGGLGGYEAALIAGFVAYHITSPTALAIALLYRLVSYWLALIVGGVAFGFCQKRRYI